MLILLSVAPVLVTLLALAVFGQPRTRLPLNFRTGDCVSQRIYPGDASRTFDLAAAESRRFVVDRAAYDFTLDYGSIETTAAKAANLNLVASRSENGTIGLGTRMSTTRYMLYGKITGRFKAAIDPGAVTTLITWSDTQSTLASGEVIQDEIDWEIVGRDPTRPETNVFTAKALDYERNSHGGPINGTVTADEVHDFTIDWRSDRIDFGIDGVLYRSLLKNESVAANPANLPQGAAWYPETPSRVQISIWDGGVGPSSSWAGGAINWGSRNKITALFEWVEIQCYDNADNPVRRWAADGSGPTAETPSSADVATSNRNAGASIIIDYIQQIATALISLVGAVFVL
ncbi:concanavalin A-like lectin/glucanase domain-containing protein [Entophlyctis helioformis]|nr:concanavalin A-like lectin/glucanase domain-containing protein [Entophlyctis helioformis]